MPVSVPITVEDSKLAQGSEDPEAVHRWYRIIMGFDWKLADSIIDMLDVRAGHLVLDPFTGAGTTLVQCRKRGIDAIGVDVNPVCTLASKVKTTWTLSSVTLSRLLEKIVNESQALPDEVATSENSALSYLLKSGMIDRGWLSLHKAKIVLKLRAAIRRTPMSSDCRDFFHLALVSAVVSKIADIKFGPELYCLPKPRRLPAVSSFVEVAEMMIDDARWAKKIEKVNVSSKVYLGNSQLVTTLSAAAPRGIDFAITSPPYPNEHDYTRSTRLELVLLDHVANIHDLRKIKREMLRCTTKGIYKDDSDASYLRDFSKVDDIARLLDERAKSYTDGFSKLYGKMTRAYFGGMAQHLKSLYQVLKPGARCAYVVRDTQSLLGVYIDTPAILAEIATLPGIAFNVDELVEWKRVKGTTGSRMLSEKIIMLRKPER